MIGNAGAATPAVEVEDRTQIDQIIEDMQKKAAAAAPENSCQKRDSQEAYKVVAALTYLSENKNALDCEGVFNA